MRPVNIYALTRIEDPELVRRMERQMSKRSGYIKVKEWEIQGLKGLADILILRTQMPDLLDFYYSFVMPKLGKEFDLLRISEKSVINIELKSGNITDDAIRKQLLQNRYYLSMLGKEIHSYTYISGENRLMKLTNSARLKAAQWEELIQMLMTQGTCYEEDIETLFKEEQYLISPLSDPEHFLRKEYFLTSQQYDIKKKILKLIQQTSCSCQGFTGLPGTGKSILLYDIALELSKRKKVCILNPGSWPEGLSLLNERLKRVDFYYCEAADEIQLQDDYGAVLIDEGHRITKQNLTGLLDYAIKKQIPLLFAYDREDALAAEELPDFGMDSVEKLDGFVKYQLTNRIRVNSELSSFVYQVMQSGRCGHRNYYPSVQITWANTEVEAGNLIQLFREKGYQYIYNQKLQTTLRIEKTGSIGNTASDVDCQYAGCMEFERVVMLIDDAFWYDEAGNLRSVDGNREGESVVRSLYHGLNRAKKAVSLIVLKNEQVFRRLMYTVQRERTLK